MQIGTAFRFEPTLDWSLSREGQRYVFHGPNREELIVYASLVQGIGEIQNRTKVQRELFRNAQQSVSRAAAHPDLETIQSFQQDIRAAKLERWTFLAQSKDGTITFSQAVFTHPHGVMLATLEATKSEQTAQIFDQFIKIELYKPTIARVVPSKLNAWLASRL